MACSKFVRRLEALKKVVEGQTEDLKHLMVEGSKYDRRLEVLSIT